jgi:hypothetical protein
MATSNVRKTLTDAGYIAIGLGVMGLQQAQIRSRELRERALKAGECVNKNTRDAQTKLQEQSRTARSRSHEQVRTTVARAQGLREQVGKRVEPVVGKVQAQLGEIPERVVQAMEPVAARVRELAGTAA